jgi:predicted metalloprotease
MIRFRIAKRAAAIVFAVGMGIASASASPPRVFADPISPQEADIDQNIAYRTADGYWATHWSQYFTGRYIPPSVRGLYDSRQVQVLCGGVPLLPKNAWYCRSEDFVVFDLAFMQQVYALGDSFIYLVVAHEWGHAMQARLGSNLQFVASELQADCFAGAVLYGAARDGELQWEAGDTQELANSLNAVADKYPWTKVSDHGNAAQRIANFKTGQAGPAACVPQ